MKQPSEATMHAYNRTIQHFGHPPRYVVNEHFFDDRRECFNNVNEEIKYIKVLAPSAHPIGESDNAHVHQTINTSAIASPSARDSQFANGSPE